MQSVRSTDRHSMSPRRVPPAATRSASQAVGEQSQWAAEMDILFLLVPISVLLVFLLMAVFHWALGAGQFDDLEREGERILESDDAMVGSPSLDADQARR